jgi:hypothetical protein
MAWWLAIVAASLAGAQEPLFQKVDRAAVTAWFASETAAWTAQAAGKAELLVLPGVRADRQARQVEVLAIATGIRREPIEFFVVGENGRDYESLAVTLAKPSDLHQALVFIGIAPGQPVDYNRLYYWPRGERVVLSFAWDVEAPGGGAAQRRTLRAEELLYDSRRERTLPKVGLVFTGSVKLPAADDIPERYAADVSGAIASNYNDAFAMLDVPYRAQQGEIYGSLTAVDTCPFAVGQRLRLILTPYSPAGTTRVRQMALEVAGPAADAAALRFALAPLDAPAAVPPKATFEQLLEQLHGELQAERDLFVQVRFGHELTVRPLAEFAPLLGAMLEKEVLRVEPRDDELYYKAFLPVEKWRARADRLLQPLELHFGAEEHRLVYLEEVEQGQEVTLREHSYPFRQPGELAGILAQRQEWQTETVFFYVTAETPYGLMADCYRALRGKFPTVFVYPPLPTVP